MVVDVVVDGTVVVVDGTVVVDGAVVVGDGGVVVVVVDGLVGVVVVVVDVEVEVVDVVVAGVVAVAGVVEVVVGGQAFEPPPRHGFGEVTVGPAADEDSARTNPVTLSARTSRTAIIPDRRIVSMVTFPFFTNLRGTLDQFASLLAMPQIGRKRHDPVQRSTHLSTANWAKT